MVDASMTFDVRRYNRGAWDAEVERKNPWTIPVSPEDIRRAREGDWQVVLTPLKAVPKNWFPPLRGLSVLGLAASGGQQAPILAAVGARVTVLDNSPAQLAQDHTVAEREGLELTLVEGDMADLPFASESFELVFHPCSNCFVPDVLSVWREAFRVLRPGGVLLAGFVNPVAFLFDDVLNPERRELVVRHRIPYSDLTGLGPRLTPHLGSNKPLIFGHTLRDQIGGQLDAGFVLEQMFEDTRPPSDGDPLSEYLSTFIATRARRPR
ncbi:MAG TPA: class I SAM-dependent methyltransferase [Polyangiaceae bacterium]|nr:class I SAM-dependent methyltransferase [Polyangiaceae bacterium]